MDSLFSWITTSAGIYCVFILATAIERLVEVKISNRNAAWSFEQGGVGIDACDDLDVADHDLKRPSHTSCKCSQKGDPGDGRGVLQVRMAVVQQQQGPCQRYDNQYNHNRPDHGAVVAS